GVALDVADQQVELGEGQLERGVHGLAALARGSCSGFFSGFGRRLFGGFPHRRLGCGGLGAGFLTRSTVRRRSLRLGFRLSLRFWSGLRFWNGLRFSSVVRSE